ncbi:SDR family NAD(P)-dependent oxidoreductase [Streptomyces sp. YGL11-2]|uniref:SDR family NAD(P)-dependent oxidoreductase n=1 Tax=Streptomyces sp. YGL11-2 TaxID=3414028 RepID=UPI003CF052B5
MTVSGYQAGPIDRAVAVVGAACRLPGGIADLGGLWDALASGKDLVTEVPEDRFYAKRFVDPAMPRPGMSYTAAGGFLHDISRFDAAYFGISPKEAAKMDPQHRLLLEMAAEACDDAAVDPAALAGSDTAVFVGISDNSYGAMQMVSDNINAYTMAGAASSIAANRLSHFFDLHGPSLIVDTACSSSLVAVVQACRTLLDGTSRAALVGGVNVLLSPFHYVGFCQAAMLSPTGRCRSFSAGADGYVRAEGGAVALLKRLTDAVADGDRIHGVIVEGAINSDGRTPGLALPRVETQEALLREVYSRAGVDPDDVAYLEAHGTGTPVGDPVECEAIGRALGVRRTRGELPLGSVKSNLGHLEPASGMAGLLKALLVLRHGEIPASLHVSEPNPHVDLPALGLEIATRQRRVELTERSVVGVNSFGFGGANAHVIVAAGPPAAPPPPAPAPAPAREVRPVVVSARGATALTEAVRRTADRLRTAEPEEFYDLAYTSCVRRARHSHRAAVLATDPAHAADQLAALADASPSDAGGLAQAAHDGRPVFAFCGNGSQWAGMGADLLAEDPVFRAAVQNVDVLLRPHLGWSVTTELAKDPTESRLAATEIAQPLLFAVQVAVVERLRHHGIEPAAVVGHSVGEIAAAWAAGALTLADAARVVAIRATAQADTRGSGRMAAVALPRAEMDIWLADHPGLEIAGVNTDRDVTICGPTDQVRKLSARLTARDVAFVELDLDYAFHSAAMDPVEEPLHAALADLRPCPARIPMVSTVTGSPIEGSALDATYWWHNIRQPVLFAPAVAHLRDEGYAVFTDIGPRPVLHPYLRRTTAGQPQRIAVVRTLTPQADGRTALDRAVATLIASGADVAWQSHFPHRGRVVDLPQYPWQRERHWSGSPAVWSGSEGDGRPDHPLLGDRLPLPEPTWQGPVEPTLVPWLTDHQVGASVIMPATGYLEMALAAGRRALGTPIEVEGLEMTRPIVVPRENPSSVHLVVSLSTEDGVIAISSREGRTGEPSQHARGRVRTLLRPPPPVLDPAALLARCPKPMSGAQHYTALTAAGLRYGPQFQVLRQLHVGDGEVLARYHYGEPADEYEAHPALMDGALQAGAPLMADALAVSEGYLPVAIGAARVWRSPAPSGVIHVRHRASTQAEMSWDITVADEDGTVAVELAQCRMRRVRSTRGTPLSRNTVVLRAAPHPDMPAAKSPLPGTASLLTAAGDRIAELQRHHRHRRHDQVVQAVKECNARGIARSLAELLPDPSSAFTVDDLVTAGMLPRHRRLVSAIAPLLERHGLLELRADGRWRLLTTDLRVETRERLVIGNDFPAFPAETLLYAHMLQHFTEVLRGACDPLELLLAEGGLEALEQFYGISPIHHHHNRVLAGVLSTVVDRWPKDRPLRVLEVGAGTGGTTGVLLPLLPPERTRYLFTDISPFFLGRAQKRFNRYDFVDYQSFDLDGDTAEQGLTEGSFDMVVAANALHTAKDLRKALRKVAGLLAPGGRLLALELHDTELLAPLIGTLETFWAFTDQELRTDSPLLSGSRWPALLAECGFTDIARIGAEPDSTDDVMSALLATPPERPVPPPELPKAESGSVWVVAAETDTDGCLPDAVCALLKDHGGRTVRTTAGEDPGQWRRLLPTDTGEITVVLILGDGPAQPLMERTIRRAAALRGLTAALAELPDTIDATLWLVTRPSGLHPAPEPVTAPEDAAVWGITRTLANEHHDLRVRRLSLQRSVDPRYDAQRLVRDILTRSDEDEIVLTANGRFVPRLIELPNRHGTADSTEAPCFTLQVRDPGISYQLAWVQSAPPQQPGPGQIAIAVHATALNYRDIMRSMGLIPPIAGIESGEEPGPGLECAGVVTAVGPEVTNVCVGDRVYGLAPGALASHVITSEHAVAGIPEGMSFTEAATLAIVYLTVHYGLGHLARLAPEETVLVHGGAGGVGLAALRYAELRHAKVIATAGTPAKRDLLEVLGAAHVLDSRSLHFATEVMSHTDGRGVDVVLNSLAGEAMSRSLELLRPGGRFIELGKRDIYLNKPLLLGPFDRNIAFFGVDLTALAHQPELAKDQFQQVSEAVRTGHYRPLPHSVFPASRIVEAFRLLQHSRHIGKVVVTFDALDGSCSVERRETPPPLDPEATYLITGGLGGFGGATAHWLADRGARHLALVSRRGAQAPEAPTLLAELADRGVRATPYAADVSDLDAMRRVVTETEASGHPLRGIVHAAMHLDDAPLTDLSDDRFRSVLLPKMAGATVLDHLTRGRSLDFFLMYSSGTAFLGNALQSNYAAANAFLEALARARRSRGEAGTAIAWGVIGGTGYVDRNGLTETMTRLGVEPVMPHEAFTAAEDLVCAGLDRAGVGRYAYSTLTKLLPAANVPRVSGLIPLLVRPAGQSREDILRALAEMPQEEARQVIADTIADMLGGVLQMSVEQLDHHRRLDEYGMDSLMGSEVLANVRHQYDIDLPPMELLRSEGTIADIARMVHTRLGLASTTTAPSASTARADLLRGEGEQPGQPDE